VPNDARYKKQMNSANKKLEAQEFIRLRLATSTPFIFHAWNLNICIPVA
jgi:hypothetical protein